ncbi:MULTISPECIES: flavin reductase family protein [Rhodomicrobium]|uniref:flavin reductase family protein n=1 Tax=Rhodomicrobium TaxID=1068 RepID=UPI000B4C06CB|nr:MULTISPECIES: flavin reductase family protein [Rhodomicrobium]
MIISPPPAPSANTPNLQRAMRQLASGVSIVTCADGGVRNGFTATSVTSLSVEPPRLLFCMIRTSTSLPLIARSRRFAVNILGAQHQMLADRFAGRMGAQGEDRFDGANWQTLATGAPILSDALASVDCELEELIERHSHVIVIGRVAGVQLAENGDGLVYWRGNYDRL